MKFARTSGRTRNWEETIWKSLAWADRERADGLAAGAQGQAGRAKRSRARRSPPSAKALQKTGGGGSGARGGGPERTGTRCPHRRANSEAPRAAPQGTEAGVESSGATNSTRPAPPRGTSSMHINFSSRQFAFFYDDLGHPGGPANLTRGHLRGAAAARQLHRVRAGPPPSEDDAPQRETGSRWDPCSLRASPCPYPADLPGPRRRIATGRARQTSKYHQHPLPQSTTVPSKQK